MRLPEGFVPGLYGAGIGAIALATVGFFWGGWLTDGEGRDARNKRQWQQ